ncbi:Aminoacyl-tRNA synthetase, class II (D/K/N)-like protein [Cordyceps fumosorosea ARSEF 2679]|uniref:Lysyl-tRNA synthetase n=1 Tax=Cordyceps fumosorosea (strain ARSEF 2679) TaxID=1081104 RepID=A0A167UH69_CORFA|nr:Aminoacyl-tRNA synthetase, class II (D/K/N)-like protein [Cordyceps fumosorosea ARSEF 2679]OAA61575.1 Aminoacyl-tRNA synthetase, class II (D/K/N)-like protein [Cordyceps fumosorosea ARSEF 2679]
MISRNCLRHCRAVAGHISRVNPALLRGFALSRQNVQTFASVPDSKNGRPIPPESRDEDEHASPFKQQRRSDLGQDQASESPLYPESYPRIESSEARMAVPEFLESEGNELSQPLVNLVGRVRAKRVVGKNLVFLDIVNEFQKVQIVVNKSKCVEPLDNVCTHNSKKFQLFRSLIQVGDHISVNGVRDHTPAGLLTLAARQIPELLSPTMEQIPEVLTDSKTKMQDRHVDMLVNKETVDVLRLRSEITKHMRDHFHSKRFLEFQTPILAENAGGAIARPFVTRATEFKDKDLALRVAPELWLKRLVVGGVDRVFEIGPAFRNEGVDATHNPEFTMCEFYSAYSSLADLIKETEELLTSLAKHTQKLIETQLTSLPPIDLQKFKRPFKQVEFVPALEEATGVRFPKLSAEDALPELLALMKLAGIEIPGDIPTSLPRLLDRLAAMYIEPKSFEEPLFIINHPACMSPLAKSFLCPKTYQLVSARAELFVGGRELANMYEEENDPKEQQRKLTSHRNLVNLDDGDIGINAPEEKPPSEEVFQDEAASEDAVEVDGVEREGETDQEVFDKHMRRPEEEDEWATSPLDRSYIKALDYGLPPTGGWGCGVERLVMLFSGATRISDCLSFGTIRNVVGLSSDAAKKEGGKH